MSVLADTNVLLRRTQPLHPSHALAVESISTLLAADQQVYFTLQNVSEFWNVVTRPVSNNGLGFSIELARAEIEKIERFLTVLPDVPGVYHEWKHLVTKHRVTGSKVHDAKLVAMMNVHGIRRLLTFNTADFTRYDIEAVHPSTLWQA